MAENNQKGLETPCIAEQLRFLMRSSGKTVCHRPKRRMFSLIDLLLLFLPKLKYIVLSALIGAIAVGCYGYYFVHPLYTGTASLSILNRKNSAYSWSDFQGGFLLMEDCKEAFRNWEITEAVRKNLELSEDCETMMDRLTVYHPPETQVLAITYTCESPEMAAEIANAYAQSGKKFIREHIDVPELNDLSLAVIPARPVGAGKRYYPVMGVLLGGALAAAVIFLRDALDDSPKTPEDIDAAAQLNTLAVIPKSNNTNAHKVREWRYR